MIVRNYFCFFLIILLCFSCSKKEIEKSTINEVNLESQMIEAYQEGLKELKAGDVLFAAKKFNEAEILFPQSEYAPKSALMAAYSYYSQNYYGDAEAELVRFLRVYPNHKDIVYAEYLLGLCYYEQIVDEKKDLQSIIDARKTFESLISKYPDTEFATDAMFKINLIDEILKLSPISTPSRSIVRLPGIFSLGHFSSTFLLTMFKTPPLLRPGDIS